MCTSLLRKAVLDPELQRPSGAGIDVNSEAPPDGAFQAVIRSLVGAPHASERWGDR